MAVKAVTYYTVVCDEPGCGRETSDLGGDYSAWSDAGTAIDEWVSADGVHTDDGKSFCYDHSAGHLCGSCGEERDTTEHEGEHWCAECIAEEGGN